MEWEQPHWSGRPKREFEPKRKLRPNGFARLARGAAANAPVVIAFYVLIAAACAVFAAVSLTVDPDAGVRVTLDDETAAAQARLDRSFPNIDQTFLAIVEGGDGLAGRERAVAIATALAAQSDLFQSAFVPGTGPFYDVYGFLFLDLDTINARVDEVLLRQPLFHALATAPDIGGLTALVTEIAKAVSQGRSPPGLGSLLTATAAVFEGEVKGVSQPIDWPMLAGLKVEPSSPRWFVVAQPRAGAERQAAAAAQRASGSSLGILWLWPRRAFGTVPNPLRDLVVPAGLSVFFALLLLAAGLGSFRLSAAIVLSGATSVAAASAAAGALGQPLDQATWSFAAAAVAPALAGGVLIGLAYQEARGKDLPVRQAVMLAAHRRAGMATVFCLLFAAFWLAWLLRQLPSMAHFSVIALVGTAVALAATLTLVPAAIAALEARTPPPEPHWIDEALTGPAPAYGRNAADVAALLVIAAAVFCAAFLPGIGFGERHLPSRPGILLDTPDARGAIHVLVEPDKAEAAIKMLSELPETGAIRTIAQFMPPEAAAKIAALRRLQSASATFPLPREEQDETLVRDNLANLEDQLSVIAASAAASEALRAAAHRLRRAVALFSNPEPPTAARIDTLETALFSGLADLPRAAGRLATLNLPAINDLEPGLLRRFVSPGGLWRIEVMPKTGTGLLSFAGAVRRAFPTAAGEPVAALARNEIVHHETLLALGLAFAAMAVLMLAGLRHAVAWAAAVVPAACLITLTAAMAAGLDLVLTSAMLAAASTVTACLACATMITAQRLTGKESAGPGGHFGTTIRTGVLPLLVLAGATAPLALSTRPGVSELGAFMAMMLLLSALLCLLLVPAIVRWSGHIFRR